MIILDIGNIYRATIKGTKMDTAPGLIGKGANTRIQNFRALNFELEVFDENGKLIGTLPSGISATNTSSHNSPLIRFFRSIGIYRDPEEFSPNELDGLNVRISVNNTCDGHGLRSIVNEFYPTIV